VLARVNNTGVFTELVGVVLLIVLLLCTCAVRPGRDRRGASGIRRR
jgi:hypothetical protein